MLEPTGRPVDLGGARGRIFKFAAALIAWLLHLGLLLAISIVQLYRTRLYPLRAVVGLLAPNRGQPEFHPLDKDRWTNAVANQFTKPAFVRRVHNLNELLAVVREVGSRRGGRVRAIGS